MRSARSRVEQLEREAGAAEPVRFYCTHLGEVAPPGAVKVTFTLDHPTKRAERADAEGEAPMEAA